MKTGGHKLMNWKWWEWSWEEFATATRVFVGIWFIGFLCVVVLAIVGTIIGIMGAPIEPCVRGE